MKMRNILVYVISVLIAFAAGAVGGIFTAMGMQAYEQLVKPSLTPPAYVFGIVWPILYLLMGISAAMIYKSDNPNKKSALAVYGVQLFLNVLWSFVFFALEASLLGLFVLILLWAVILLMIRTFLLIDEKAGLLQIPYLLWVTFAGYLNLGIWLLNR